MLKLSESSVLDKMRILKKVYYANLNKVLTTSLLSTNKPLPVSSQAIYCLKSNNIRGEVGINMTIFGRHNAGKSSLFKFLGNHVFFFPFVYSTFHLSLLCIANHPASIVILS